MMVCSVQETKSIIAVKSNTANMKKTQWIHIEIKTKQIISPEMHDPEGYKGAK